MRQRVRAVAVVVTLLLGVSPAIVSADAGWSLDQMAATRPRGRVGSQATPAAGAVAGAPSPCDAIGQATVSDPSAPDPALVDGVPTGISLSVLGAGSVQSLPPAPARLVLSRLTLASGAGVDNRFAVGPLVYYVEAGDVTFYVEGIETAVPSGQAILVPMNGLYAFANRGAGVASLLRLGVIPLATDDQPIMNLPTPPPVAATPLTPPVSELLVDGQVDVLPAVVATLVLACLTWTDPVASLGDRAYPGPIGIRVEQGQLRIDGTIDLGEDGCTLFQADGVHRVEAGGVPPTVLIFGVIRDGARLWSTEAGAIAGEAALEPPAALTCGAG